MPTELHTNISLKVTPTDDEHLVTKKYVDDAVEAGGPGGPGGAGETGPTGDTGPKGDTGDTGPTGAEGAGVNIKGAVADESHLPSSGNAIGDIYITLDNDHSHIWDGTDWNDIGPGLRGPMGETGPSGDTGATGETGASGGAGASAYDVWLGLGNTGTEQDFIDSITDVWEVV